MEQVNGLPEIRAWTVLQHVAWEGPGLIVAEAKRRGLRLDVRRLDLGATVPKMHDVDGLVVMGGPMGAYEADKYPFIAEECRLIEQLVGNGRPVLGVCLGAQVLAHALGARVYPGNGPELGFGFVELTELGEQDPVVGIAGSSLPVFHWHGDTFDLPIGAALLASSVPYPHQAFRFGNTAYGLQFHVEPDPGTWLAWREHLPKGLLEETELKQHLIEHVGRTVIGNFFDVARGSGPTADTFRQHAEAG